MRRLDLLIISLYFCDFIPQLCILQPQNMNLLFQIIIFIQEQNWNLSSIVIIIAILSRRRKGT
jgi:hypothetical protein